MKISNQALVSQYIEDEKRKTFDTTELNYSLQQSVFPSKMCHSFIRFEQNIKTIKDIRWKIT